jgi:hypothetical protein
MNRGQSEPRRILEAGGRVRVCVTLAFIVQQNIECNEPVSNDKKSFYYSQDARVF